MGIAIEERMTFFIDLSVYGYQFLAYSPAAIAAASLITAWTLSEMRADITNNIQVLATACELEVCDLRLCVSKLMRYYQTCFPEHSNGTATFIPIAEEERPPQALPNSPIPTSADAASVT